MHDCERPIATIAGMERCQVGMLSTLAKAAAAVGVGVHLPWLLRLSTSIQHYTLLSKHRLQGNKEAKAIEMR
jgi:hypothetical protein